MEKPNTWQDMDGYLREYDITREDWLACTERSQPYLAANDGKCSEAVCYIVPLVDIPTNKELFL